MDMSLDFFYHAVLCCIANPFLFKCICLFSILNCFNMDFAKQGPSMAKTVNTFGKKNVDFQIGFKQIFKICLLPTWITAMSIDCALDQALICEKLNRFCLLKQCCFHQNFIYTLFIVFKMAYSQCFSLGGNFDFLDFLQKKFQNNGYRAATFAQQ